MLELQDPHQEDILQVVVDNNETPGAAPNQGTGGTGGGADGDVPGSNGNAGTANTGGGGGGMDTNPSHPSADHNGGSGIVIIRYKFQ